MRHQLRLNIRLVTVNILDFQSFQFNWRIIDTRKLDAKITQVFKHFLA
jgi:type II secretory pathway component HofQ